MTPSASGARVSVFKELFADGRPPGVVRRDVAVEAPVAIEFNGIGYAVMMATPTDLEDFLTGFAITERLVKGPSEIMQTDIAEAENGWVIRAELAPAAAAPVFERARQRVTESSCGLCGVENLDRISSPLPPITDRLLVSEAAVFAARSALREHQPLGQQTGAVHAAAFCTIDGKVAVAREDVGRHNALDKLIGACARRGISMHAGFVLLTARCSYELVEKTVIAGGRALVTISAPTTLALDRARQAGLTLYTLARADSMLRSD